MKTSLRCRRRGGQEETKRARTHVALRLELLNLLSSRPINVLRRRRDRSVRSSPEELSERVDFDEQVVELETVEGGAAERVRVRERERER